MMRSENVTENRVRSEFLASLASYNASNSTAPDQPPGNQTTPNSWWAASLHWAQGGLTAAGMLGNFLVILTLLRRRYKSQFASAVFLHQTVMDFMVCVFTLVLLVKPDQNPTDSVGLGFVLCHVISSQLLYWYFVFSSVQNLVLIAIDRYFAVYRPVKYKTLTFRSAAVHLSGLHCYSLAVNVIDIFSVEFDRDSNKCSTEITNQFFKKVFKVYGFFWFFMVYLLPVAAVVFLYSVIIYRLGNQGQQSSRFRQRAATELTKSAVIITVIFIVCFSYDCIYYLLGHLDLVEYVYNSPTQLIGVALVTINSCANPVVYCIIMPSFRERMLSAVCCCDQRCRKLFRWLPCGEAETSARAAAATDGREARYAAQPALNNDRHCDGDEEDGVPPSDSWEDDDSNRNGTALVTLTVSVRCHSAACSFADEAA